MQEIISYATDAIMNKLDPWLDGYEHFWDDDDFDRYVEEIYWTWMYKLSISPHKQGQEVEEYAKDLLMKTITQTYDFVNTRDIKGISDKYKNIAKFFVAQIKEEERADMVWNIFIQPLAAIKSFIEAQSFKQQLSSDMHTALQKVMKTDDPESELHTVKEKVEDAITNIEKNGQFVVLSVYVHPDLKKSRGYDLIKQMVYKEADNRHFSIEIVDTIEDLDKKKTAHHGIKRIPLILVFDGEPFEKRRNVYYFSKDFKEFTHDLFLFPLFFDALLAKGLHIGAFPWLGNIGKMTFHQDIAAHINSAILEKIEERIVQVAA